MPKKSVKVKPKRKRIEFSYYSPIASEVFLERCVRGQNALAER